MIEGGFFTKTTKLYSIDNIEYDFSDMPKAFCAYIRLKSYQKKQTRISARINRYKKYYERPTELFARLVEGIYLDREWVEAIAPNVTRQFFDLLNDGYYKELKDVIDKISKNFDFKAIKKQNLASLEEVIINKYNLFVNKYSIFLT